MRMSPLVAGESPPGKDGSLLSLVPRRMQDVKPVEDRKCCISQHLQFEAEKQLSVSKGFGILPGGTAPKKSRVRKKRSQLTEFTKNPKSYK